MFEICMNHIGKYFDWLERILKENEDNIIIIAGTIIAVAPVSIVYCAVNVLDKIEKMVFRSDYEEDDTGGYY